MMRPAIRPARDEETEEGAGLFNAINSVDEGDEEATAFYISPGAESEGAFEGLILPGAAYETLAAEAEA